MPISIFCPVIGHSVAGKFIHLSSGYHEAWLIGISHAFSHMPISIIISLDELLKRFNLNISYASSTGIIRWRGHYRSFHHNRLDDGWRLVTISFTTAMETSINSLYRDDKQESYNHIYRPLAPTPHQVSADGQLEKRWRHERKTLLYWSESVI